MTSPEPEPQPEPSFSVTKKWQVYKKRTKMFYFGSKTLEQETPLSVLNTGNDNKMCGPNIVVRM